MLVAVVASPALIPPGVPQSGADPLNNKSCPASPLDINPVLPTPV